MTGVSISPGVFHWLWLSSGVTIDEISKRINESPETVTRWCLDEVSPRLSVRAIEKLSATFKRPISAFLLPEAPEENNPKDFRRVKNADHLLSRDTWVAIRRARRHLDAWRALREINGEDLNAHLPLYSLDSDPEEAAAKERRRLKVSDTTKWKDPSEAYRYWRSLLESLALPVFQVGMPIIESRGFALRADDTVLIVVNGSDAMNGRIFSLFHEYAHLILNELAICNIESDTNPDKTIQRIEKWCNRFAGAFLMPQAAISSNSRISKPLARGDVFSSVKALAARQKVSREAAAVRLRVLNIISESGYHETISRIRAEEEEKKARQQVKQEGGGFKNPARDCRIEHGDQFVSMALNSEAQGRITFADMLNYLELKASYIGRLQGGGRDF